VYCVCILFLHSRHPSALNPIFPLSSIFKSNSDSPDSRASNHLVCALGPGVEFGANIVSSNFDGVSISNSLQCFGASFTIKGAISI